jgi:hypothetical protein
MSFARSPASEYAGRERPVTARTKAAGYFSERPVAKVSHFLELERST